MTIADVALLERLKKNLLELEDVGAIRKSLYIRHPKLVRQMTRCGKMLRKAIDNFMAEAMPDKLSDR